MKTIGLCMIVKNEARLILRCLESVRPLLDYVLIEDTGSTDGTQEIIRQYLEREKLPGEVFDEPWRDFAHNRSIALAQLRQQTQIDYALIMDADDVLVCEDGFDVVSFKAALNADLYNVEICEGAIRYHRPLICSNRLGFHYRGVLHEFLEAPKGGHSAGTATGLHITSRREGARSQDPDKYRKDALLLEQALATEQDPFLRSRYTFYMAQSWRDCGETEKALAAYLDRANIGYWEEEVFVSLYRAAQLKEKLGHSGFEIIGMFLRAYEACPRRAEALHGAARYCRVTKNFHQGYLFAKEGFAIPQPVGGLFVEPWIYEYGLLDEFAVNAYWIERYDECRHACERLLSEGKIPDGIRERVEMNASFARNKLGSSVSEASSTLGQQSSAPALSMAAISDDARTAGDPAYPRVLLAILAKQKEPVLPFYLMCIDALDYPKDRIVLYVRTNNNTDRTADILRNWLERVGHQYAHVEFDTSDVIYPVEKFAVHEWNPARFKVLARIRQQSMQFALDNECDYYFVVDVDNFLKPHTLKSLVASNLPIVAPLLRHEDQARLYSNYHEKIDARGYFLQSDEYNWILFQRVKGVCQVPVVHCTYLVRRDVIPLLSYEDGSGRHEYVIFSDSARRQGIPQYLDNRDIYGYLTLDESPGGSVCLLGASVAVCTKKADIAAARSKRRAQGAAVTANVTPIFIHSSWRTSSTWFWSKFRQLPATLAFYEPFHQFLNSITVEQALAADHEMWRSRHSPTEPYYLEYVPLVRRGGGVRLFEPSIPYRWFIPSGGLRGDLRSQEQRYLALLVREAQRRGRVPVLGFCRSLGRISAIKKAFAGLDVFLFRNLWTQWLSYLAFKKRGDRYFYDTVPLLVNRTDDKFLEYLANYYIARAARAEGRSEATGLVSTPEGYRLLSSLTEPDAFGMFMALHIYLYLHSQLAVDVTIDATRMARDEDYRAAIEGDLQQRTGLPLSFSDVRDEGPKLLDIDTDAIDWAAIREHGRNAARALGAVADVDQLAESAMAFVTEAFDQSRLQLGQSAKTLEALASG